MLGTIIEQAKEYIPTPEDWQRYAELRSKSKPTAKEVAEFKELLAKLKITPAEAELHAVVLSEAERLEELIKGQADAQAADATAQKAEAAAREVILDDICKLQAKLQNNDFPEAQTYNSIRRKWTEEIMPAQKQLSTLYARFPGLFDFSLDTKRSTNEDYTKAVMTKMTELKIQVFETC